MGDVIFESKLWNMIGFRGEGYAQDADVFAA